MTQLNGSESLSSLSIIEDDSFGVDAQAQLVELIKLGAVQLNGGALQEVMFCEAYCSEGFTLMARLMDLRMRTGGTLFKRATEAIKAQSLFDKLNAINLGVSK